MAASLVELMRRGVKLKTAPPSPIRLVTETSLSQRQKHISGTKIQPTQGEQIEQRTALAQPHRQELRIGDEIIVAAADRRWTSALGRFCLAHKPRPLGEHMYETGLQYGIVILEWKRSQEFDGENIRVGDHGSDILTEEQKGARRELACKRRKEADGLLWSVGCKPAMMERLCYDDLDIGEAERQTIVDGMIILAKKWHYWPMSEMRGT